MKSFCIFVIVNVAFFGAAQGAEDELEAVVAIFRHGDRTPIKPYPTDPYRNVSFWPVDFGQLTNTGKLQLLELGRWLRDRYSHFLPLFYSEKDIYVRSTDVDRTLMSAEASLAGLYPPVSKQIWDLDLKWQPIPIHTIPELDDALLASKKPCTKYDVLEKQLAKTPFFKNITHKNHDLYAYLTKYSGETVADLETVEYIYSTLTIETAYNFTLPNWATKVFPNKLEPWAFLSFAVPTFTMEMARLKTGPLFNEIISFFKDHDARKFGIPKIKMYSGHDITIASVLNSMKLFEYHAPPYASTILFELRRRGNGRTYINIFYKNTTEPQQMHLKQCEVDCDLTDFIAILKPITITLDEWENTCRLKWSYIMPLNFQLSLILICAGLITMVCSVFLIGFRKSRSKKENNYVQLPDEEYA